MSALNTAVVDRASRYDTSSVLSSISQHVLCHPIIFQSMTLLTLEGKPNSCTPSVRVVYTITLEYHQHSNAQQTCTWQACGYRFCATKRLALVKSTFDGKPEYFSEVLSQAVLVYKDSCEPSIAGFEIPLLEELQEIFVVQCLE